MLAHLPWHGKFLAVSERAISLRYSTISYWNSGRTDYWQVWDLSKCIATAAKLNLAQNPRPVSP